MAPWSRILLVVFHRDDGFETARQCCMVMTTTAAAHGIWSDKYQERPARQFISLTVPKLLAPLNLINLLFDMCGAYESQGKCPPCPHIICEPRDWSFKRGAP